MKPLENAADKPCFNVGVVTTKLKSNVFSWNIKGINQLPTSVTCKTVGDINPVTAPACAIFELKNAHTYHVFCHKSTFNTVHFEISSFGC